MMDLESRSRRTFTYFLWMLGSALVPVGINFPFGSSLQILFMTVGITLFVLGHILFRGAWSR